MANDVSIDAQPTPVNLSLLMMGRLGLTTSSDVDVATSPQLPDLIIAASAQVAAIRSNTLDLASSPIPPSIMTIDELMAAARSNHNTDIVWDNIPTFAALSDAEAGKFIAKLRDLFGNKLDIRRLNKAMKEVKPKATARPIVTVNHNLSSSASPGAPNGPGSAGGTGASHNVSSSSLSVLPTIVGSHRQLRDITNECLTALTAVQSQRHLFTNGNSIVTLRSNTLGQMVMEPLLQDALRGELTRCANFEIMTITKDGPTPHEGPPPLDTVRDILALPTKPFNSLISVTHTSVLRFDGSILSAPGYDRPSQLFLDPIKGDVQVPVPDSPDQHAIASAISFIDEAIGDFPFADEASKANVIALMLTLVMRPAIEGCIPMFLIDAPLKGSGKGLVARVFSHICTGQELPVGVFPTHEDEVRKQITTSLMEGARIISFDNVTRELESPSLAAALTSVEWTGRVLGQNRNARVPQRSIWIATGNNIAVGSDMGRRCVRIRLDAKMAEPWTRSTFIHPDLIEWVKTKRSALLSAVLTLARAWYAASSPAAQVQPMGSFEEWSRKIGSVMAFVGIQGFLGSQAAFYQQANEESAQWAAFLANWFNVLGDTPTRARQVIDLFHQPTGIALKDSLPGDLLGDLMKNPHFDKKFGQALASKTDTQFGDKRLERAGSNQSVGVALWKVVNLSTPVAVSAMGTPGLPGMPGLLVTPTPIG